MGQKEQRATPPLVVDATPVENLLLSATPNVEINGQFPALPSGATISQLLLKSADGSIRDRSTSVKGGVFHFHCVPAGEYILSLSLGQQVYVDAVSVWGKSIESSDSQLHRGKAQ